MITGFSVDMASRLLKLLNEDIPNPKVALHSATPLQLLVATILSAQCTDERVNQVTTDLFRKHPQARDYAEVDLGALEEEIRPTFREIKGGKSARKRQHEGRIR